jgi:eukaryotic-like serine/threonine-protein kinase
MSPERWQRIEELYHSALEHPPEQRSAFLSDACAGDDELRREVESLLGHAGSGEALMNRPAWEAAADLLKTDTTDRAGSLAGRRISHYEILEKLGEGGMGAVYKARDTRLGRLVAVKVVDARFTNRFEREARAIAALNHPHICTLHDVGEHEGVPYLVMEYLEGKPLEGPLPTAVALLYAIQVCEALAAAHKAGIVHRDLKPDNVLLTAEGSVKVLDFGLAKLQPGAAPGKPALSTMTERGMITGTAAYMSPEQAQGQPVDERSDIFSFGAVLYELLSGRRAFRRETIGDTLAAVIASEPPPLREAPPELARIVEKMLAKKRESRYQTAEELLADLRAASRSGPLPGLRVRWLVLAAATVVVVAGAAVLWRSRQGSGDGTSTLRVEFSQLTAEPGIEWFPSLSPDGRWLVYGGASGSGRHIYLQAVGGQNRLDLTRDSASDDDEPAFSPDGEQIAFHSSREGGGIFVMGRTGEAARRVTRFGFNPAWSPDGTHLVFNTENVELYPQNVLGRSELWTVAVNTGETRRLYEGEAVLASWSPHGKRIAYTNRIVGTPPQGDVWTIPATGGTPSRVTQDPARDWNPVWSPDGKYLYFGSDRGGSMNLWRVRIDEASGKVLREPEPLTTPASYLAHLSMSADGKRIAFTSALITANIQQLALSTSFEPIGEPAWVTTGSRRWSSPDPSPDGNWVAFYSLTQPEGQIYVAHPDGTGLRQVTSGAEDRVPRWSPDSGWIAAFSNRSGTLELWKIQPDGSGLQQLTACRAGYVAWSPDGSRIATVFSVQQQDAGALIFDPSRPWKEQSPSILPPLSPPSDSFLVNSWSPDGRSLAGQVTGDRPGIAVYSLAAHTYQHLTDFGEWPVWLPDSRRLLFVANGNAFYTVDSSSRQVRKVFSVARDVIGPPRITPDGRKAYFSRRVTESDIWLCSFR